MANEDRLRLGFFEQWSKAMQPMTYTMAHREDVLASYNLGSNTFTMRMPLQRFIDTSDVASAGGIEVEEIAQRPLDKTHAASLALYILKGVVSAARNVTAMSSQPTEAFDEILERMGNQTYFSLQPVVVNIPTSLESLNPKPQENVSGDAIAVRISLPPGLLMWVVDGQHRRYAMNTVLQFLRGVTAEREYPRKGSLFPFGESGPSVAPSHLQVWRQARDVAFNHCTVAIEAHVGLSAEQQRQLFHDLNNLGKRVTASLSFDFDTSNPVNNFVKEVLIDERVLSASISERDVTDWRAHDGSMARKDVVAVSSILFLNKTNPKTATPLQVARLSDTAIRFWRQVSQIPGFGEDGAKSKTVAAQPVVLKALAKLTYDFAVGRWVNSDHLERLLNGIGEIDFSHANEMWSYFDLGEEKRINAFPGLSEFLPREDGNRDIGARDEEGKMRFGAKHNDIYPILGDMIRWRLRLPSRHSTAETEEIESPLVAAL